MADKEYKISDLSEHLFWDVDRSKVEWERSAAYIIESVLEYGNLNDWKIIKKKYGDNYIKKIVTNIRSLDPVTLSFLSTIYDLPLEKFRCYILQQSRPKHWNF